MIVNIFEARNRLSRLIKSARAGETVMIANRGRPVVQLVPVDEAANDSGPDTRFLEWLDANPLPDSLRRDATDIEAGIEEERSGWD